MYYYVILFPCPACAFGNSLARDASRVRVPHLQFQQLFFYCFFPHLFCLKGSTASLAIAIGGEETWKIFMLPSLPWRLLNRQFINCIIQTYTNQADSCCFSIVSRHPKTSQDIPRHPKTSAHNNVHIESDLDIPDHIVCNTCSRF